MVTMRIMITMMILGCSLLIQGTLGSMNENEVIHIGGKVMCQDCSKGWNDWVKGANPITGVTVSVTCLDERKRVACYKSDKTDEDGEFSMVMEKIMRGKKLNPKNCIVRLVSSPDRSCNVATNFAKGKTGVKLGQPTVVYRDITKYRLGPFYYTTPACACSDDDDVHSQ